MVTVVQLVEHQVVILAVAGSSPVGHPEQKARSSGPGLLPFSETRYPPLMTDNTVDRYTLVRCPVVGQISPSRQRSTGKTP